MIVPKTKSSIFRDSVNAYNMNFPTAPSPLPAQDTVTPNSDFNIYINMTGLQAFNLYYNGLPSGASVQVATSQDPKLLANPSIPNAVGSEQYIVISLSDFPLNSAPVYQNSQFMKIAHAQTYSATNTVLEEGHQFTSSTSGSINIIEVYRTIAPFYRVSFDGVAGSPLELSLITVGDR